MALTFERKDELKDGIVQKINNFVEQCSDGDLSYESPHAEYAESLGYGDSEVDLRNLSDEVADTLNKMKGKQLNRWLLDNNLVSVVKTGIYRCDGEIFSITVGETEHELPLDILKELDTLSDEEKDFVAHEADGYLKGGYIYLNHNYDRFVAVVDEDEILEVLKEQGLV